MDLIGKIEDIDDVSPMTFPFDLDFIVRIITVMKEEYVKVNTKTK